MPAFRTCIFLFFLVMSISLPAQQKFTPEQWDEKLDNCYSLLMKGSPEEGFECLQKLGPFLEKSGDYAGITDYYLQMSEYYMFTGQPDKAMRLVKKGFKKHESHLSEEQKIQFRLMEIRVLENQSRNRDIISRVKEILPAIKEERNKAILYSLKASALVASGEYESGARDYFDALRIFKSLNDTTNIITVYNRLGLLNQNLMQHQKAVGYFHRALDYALPANRSVDLLPVYVNLGTAYEEMDSTGIALTYYQKGMELAKDSGNRKDLAQLLNNMGSAYLKTGDSYRALFYFKESLAISREEKIQVGIMHNHNQLGDAYTLAGAYKLAKSNYDSALFYARQLQLPENQAEIYDGLFGLYRKQGDSDNALANYMKSDSIRDALLNRDKQKAIAELEIRYETEVKDHEIERMASAFKVKKNQILVLVLVIIFLVLIGVMVILFLIYRNRTLRQLYERNVELSESLKIQEPIKSSESTASRQYQEIYDNLMYLISEEKIHREPGLTIDKTARKLSTNQKYLSSTITSFWGDNFNNFINSYRIRDARQMILSSPAQPLQDVMEQCGFNSRTAFYMAFKKHTGMSPKKFKDLSTESKR